MKKLLRLPINLFFNFFTPMLLTIILNFFFFNICFSNTNKHDGKIIYEIPDWAFVNVILMYLNAFSKNAWVFNINKILILYIKN